MAEFIRVVQLSLHSVLVGHLIGFQHGRNVLIFDDAFRTNINRPTLSILTYDKFLNASKMMSTPWIKSLKLHPLLSNLLPEGSLRTLIASNLKIHIDDEFALFSYLGNDLPGALLAEAVDPKDIPSEVLKHLHGDVTPIKFDVTANTNKFSLAGVQLKFSMKHIGDRYTLGTDHFLGDWIVKTPSVLHKELPLNEYTAMKLAELAGVTIPEIKLVPLNQLDGLQSINIPQEQFAFAIKRFDRQEKRRIHIEDFAQILAKYPHEKYNSGNYEQIGQILLSYSGEPLLDIQELTRRLLVNILLANGDAHLKNWSLIYDDKVIPRLSPAYDIVTTRAYMLDEREYALNLNKNKDWYQVSLNHFEGWAKFIDIPWKIIKKTIDDVLDKTRCLWPQALQDLPMNEQQKEILKIHWRHLNKDFKI